MLKVVESGSLFDSDAEALVNPVNTEGIMGAGLAKEFRRRWPVMYQEYAQICRRGMLDVGMMHFWLTGSLIPRFVVNFPTKRQWREPSCLEWVDMGLVELATQMEIRNIQSIAMPALGCGLGGLPWEDVERLVRRRFAANWFVRVHLYAPQPQPVRQPARRRRPAKKK